MKSSCARSLILVVLLTVLAGCAPRPTAVERPTGPPLSPEARLSLLQSRTASWQSYQARLGIKAEGPKGKFSVQTVVLGLLPDQFRLEAFKLGQNVGVLILNRKQASLWVPSERALYTADRAETLIERFLGAPVPLETFGYSLVASVPPVQLKDLQIHPDSAGWRAVFQGPRQESTWRFLSQPQALRSIEVREGPWSTTIAYDPPVALAPEQTPRKINFSSSQWRMEVAVEQIQRSPTLQAGAFEMPSVSGMRRVVLDEAP